MTVKPPRVQSHGRGPSSSQEAAAENKGKKHEPSRVDDGDHHQPLHDPRLDLRQEECGAGKVRDFTDAATQVLR